MALPGFPSLQAVAHLGAVYDGVTRVRQLGEDGLDVTIRQLLLEE